MASHDPVSSADQRGSPLPCSRGVDTAVPPLRDLPIGFTLPPNSGLPHRFPHPELEDRPLAWPGERVSSRVARSGPPLLQDGGPEEGQVPSFGWWAGHLACGLRSRMPCSVAYGIGSVETRVVKPSRSVNSLRNGWGEACRR